jgi:hypothetical protein
MKSIFMLAVVLCFAGSASAQAGKQIRVKVVYDTGDANSAAVGPLLVQQIAAQPKFFDSSPSHLN